MSHATPRRNVEARSALWGPAVTVACGVLIALLEEPNYPPGYEWRRLLEP